MMHGCGKSDFAIVAEKPTNKAEQSAAESAEPRAETKGNANQQSTQRTQSRVSVSQALERMRQAFAVWTRGRSRMRESCMYGSVRGARGNSRPYRDRRELMSPADSGGATSTAATFTVHDVASNDPPTSLVIVRNQANAQTTFKSGTSRGGQTLRQD